MNDNIKNSIKEQLKLHEGLRLKPYKDSVGKWTIGFGRNLEANPLSFTEVINVLEEKGITIEIAEEWLEEEIIEVKDKLRKKSWFNNLDLVRQKVIIDMAFNIGIPGLLEFKKMIFALKKKDYERAAEEMIDSRWYNQVGGRAKRLVEMMRTGEDYS